MNSQNNVALFKIEESFKKFFYIVMFIIIIFISFLVVISVVVIPILPSQKLLIAYFIILTYCGMIILSIRSDFWGFTKIRLFSISDQGIVIDVPHKPVFHINWTDFEAIEVKKESMLFVRVKHEYFNIKFKSNSIERNFKLELGIDFKVKTIEEILSAIKNSAKKLNKTYVESEI